MTIEHASQTNTCELAITQTADYWFGRIVDSITRPSANHVVVGSGAMRLELSGEGFPSQLLSALRTEGYGDGLPNCCCLGSSLKQVIKVVEYKWSKDVSSRTRQVGIVTLHRMKFAWQSEYKKKNWLQGSVDRKCGCNGPFRGNVLPHSSCFVV